MANENDALVAHVLAHGPDPLLSGDLTHDLMPPQTVSRRLRSHCGRATISRTRMSPIHRFC
jgi:hypothetical protein